MAASTGAGSNRRLFIILGIGAALILLNFVVPKVFFDSGGDEPSVLPRTSQGAAGPTPTTASDGQTPPEETFEVFTMKNPFTPVIGGSSSNTIPDSSTTSTTQGPFGSSTTSTTTSGGGSTTSTTTTQSTEPRTSQEVEMLELFTDTDGTVVAQVRVDNLVSKVAEGDVFAGNYEVVSLSLAEQCGVFLLGDDRFNLCVGDELLK